jgi:hypothetical protein
VYAATDNFGDGYAIGTSADEGTTWQALMTYADVKAITPCLKTFCQDVCNMEVSVSLWSADVCAADPPGTTGAAGTGGGGAAGMAGQGGTGTGGTGGMAGAGGSTGGKPPAKHSGCAVAGADVGAVVDPRLLAILLLTALFRRRAAR